MRNARNALSVQIRAIVEYAIADSQSLTGLDLGDLRDLAIALGMGATALHAEVDARFDPAPAGLLSGIGKAEGGAA